METESKATRTGVAGTPTFGEVAAVERDEISPYRMQPRSMEDWVRNLKLHVLPHVGDRPIRELGARDVRDVLEPLWARKPATARKAAGVIRRVLDRAVAWGLRDDNPTAEAVAMLPRVRQVVRAPVLSPGEIAELLGVVRCSRARPATKLAFELMVLTARRPGEVCAAHWDGVNLQAAMWTVGVGLERRCRRGALRVALSSHAVGLLHEARELNGGSGFVFRDGSERPVSSASLSALLRRVDGRVRPMSVRRTFAAWCVDTGVDPYVAVPCLGGVLPSVELVAGPWWDQLPARRPVMEDWAVVVAGPSRAGGR